MTAQLLSRFLTGIFTPIFPLTPAVEPFHVPLGWPSVPLLYWNFYPDRFSAIGDTGLILFSVVFSELCLFFTQTPHNGST